MTWKYADILPKSLTVRKQDVKGDYKGKNLCQVRKKKLKYGECDLGGEEDILSNPWNSGDSSHEDVTCPDQRDDCDISLFSY